MQPGQEVLWEPWRDRTWGLACASRAATGARQAGTETRRQAGRQAALFGPPETQVRKAPARKKHASPHCPAGWLCPWPGTEPLRTAACVAVTWAAPRPSLPACGLCAGSRGAALLPCGAGRAPATAHRRAHPPTASEKNQAPGTRLRPTVTQPLLQAPLPGASSA